MTSKDETKDEKSSDPEKTETAAPTETEKQVSEGTSNGLLEEEKKQNGKTNEGETQDPTTEKDTTVEKVTEVAEKIDGQEKDETAKTKDETMIRKGETILTKDEIMIAKDETIKTNDETIIKEAETIVTKDNTIITNDETMITNDETVITKDETMIAKDETMITIDKTIDTIEESIETQDDAMETIEGEDASSEEKSPKKVKMPTRASKRKLQEIATPDKDPTEIEIKKEIASEFDESGGFQGFSSSDTNFTDISPFDKDTTPRSIPESDIMGKGKRARIPNKRYSEIALSNSRKSLGASKSLDTDLNEEITIKEEPLEVPPAVICSPQLSQPPAAKKGRMSSSGPDLQDPKFLKPFKHGWKRELVWRSISANEKRNGDIYYYTPTGKKVRSMREVSEQIDNRILTLDNFTYYKAAIGLNDPEKEIIRDAKLIHSKSDTAIKSAIKNSSIKNLAKPGLKKILSPKISSPKLSSPKLSSPKLSSPKISSPRIMSPKIASAKIASPKLASTKVASPKVLSPKLRKANDTKATNKNAKVKKEAAIETPNKKNTKVIIKKLPAKTPEPAKTPAKQTKAKSPEPSPRPTRRGRPSVNPPAKSESESMELDSLSPSPVKMSPLKTNKPYQPCSIRCEGVQGIIPTLQCRTCLCLYHNECVGVDHNSDEPYICKNCQDETVNVDQEDEAPPLLEPPPLTPINTLKSVGGASMPNILPKLQRIPRADGGDTPPIQLQPPVLTPITMIPELPMLTPRPQPQPQPTVTFVTHIQKPPLMQRLKVTIPRMSFTPPKPVVILPIEKPQNSETSTSTASKETMATVPQTVQTSTSASTVTPLVPVNVSPQTSMPESSKSLVGAVTSWLPQNVKIVNSSESTEVLRPQYLEYINGKRFIVIPKHNLMTVTPSARSEADTVVPSDIQTSKTPPPMDSASLGPSAAVPEIKSEPPSPIEESREPAVTPAEVTELGKDTPLTEVTQDVYEFTKVINNNKTQKGPRGKKAVNANSVNDSTVEKPVAKFMENYLQNLSFGYNTLLYVFQYLKVQDLLRAGCVCTMWRDIASHPILWKTVRMKNSQVHSFEGLANTLKSHGTVNLDLRKMLLPNSGDEIWPEFSKAIAKVDTLRKIELCRCPASVVEQLAVTNPQLEVINAVTIKCEVMELDTLRNLQNIKELRLKATNGLNISSIDSLGDLKSLKVLSLTSVNELHRLNLNVFGELTSLEQLDLGECTDFSKSFGKDILSKLKRLERLRLEKGQGSCHTFDILDAVKNMPRLEQLELVNFDIKAGFDKALGACTNIKKLMIIPTYISQSATTNNMVLSGVLRLQGNLTHFVWGVTLELLRVTELFVDQCEEPKEKKEKRPTGNGDSIPVLKPVPDLTHSKEIPVACVPPQVEILPLPNLQKLLLNSLPTTRVKILKIPFHATWRQALTDSV